MVTPGDGTFVIVGGGVAAAEAAKTLRGEGFGGRVVVVAEEPHLPYQRPPLSKEYLRGEAGDDKLVAPDPAFYESGAAEVLTGRRVVGLDPAARSVRLDDGSAIRYDGLLLATGTRATVPALDGVDRPWVHFLRTVADADRLRAAAGSASSAVVAGGGWIAAEVAASLRQMGLEVTLALPRGEVLERHLGPVVGARLSAVHEMHGVRIVRRARVSRILDGHEGRGVGLKDGDVLAGDLVVLGFGATPRIELAAGAGLAVGGGILVDERLMTSADGIYAAGDVASAINPRYGRRVRAEHWDNARRQARTAARNLLGKGEAYERIPYFYSDQFDLGMEVIGMPGDGDELIVREVDAAGTFIAAWLSDGAVVGAMHGNAWDSKKAIDRLVSAGARIEPDRFRDPGIPLDALLPVAPPA